MRRIMDRAPSPAIAVAVLALVAAVAGTAVAGEPASTSKLTTKKVKKIAKKQAKKQITKLAPGLSVASAAQVDTLQVDPENVPAAASLGAAPEITLLTYGPFTVYGKCFDDGAAQIDGEVYIKTTTAGAVLDSDDDFLNGSSGYLDPGTLEIDREIENDADANNNDADSDASDFDAVLGGTKLQGNVAAYAKQGTPAAGNGTYGAGNRCIFDAFGTQTGA